MKLSATQLLNDTNTVKSDYALSLQELSKFYGNTWKQQNWEAKVPMLLVILRSKSKTLEGEKKLNQQTYSDVTEISLAQRFISNLIFIFIEIIHLQNSHLGHTGSRKHLIVQRCCTMVYGVFFQNQIKISFQEESLLPKERSSILTKAFLLEVLAKANGFWWKGQGIPLKILTVCTYFVREGTILIDASM